MWITLLAAGCAHPVEIVSVPAGASVLRGEEALGTTPITLDVASPQSVTARLPGHRDLTVKVRRRDRHVELRLMPEHGGVGTWDPDDVSR